MRTFRSSMLVAMLGGVAAVGQMAACGGDDPPATTPGDDAGGASDAAPPLGPTLTISETEATLYLGQTARLDTEAIAGGIASPTWTVVRAPSLSAITTASLEGAATATPSFVPDVLGTFTLRVSGTRDGVLAEVLVFVEAVDASVFWREATLSGGAEISEATIVTRVRGLHGGTESDVGCAAKPDAGSSTLMVSVVSARLGGSGGDVWEAPPGQPSRIATPGVTIEDDGRVVLNLNVGTSRSACGAPEARAVDALSIDPSDEGPTPSTFDGIFAVRFSPDGSRIAYLRQENGAARLVTIGFDGSARRALAPFQSLGGSAGLEPDAGAPLIVGASSTPTGQLAARWKDATHVGWITFVGPTATTPARDAWELYVVEDREGATATLAMTCSGTAPQTFDFLPDGSIVAAVTEFAEGGGSSASNVVVYEANETTKICTIARKLTANADEDVAIGDVALSPDKTTVAFFSGGRLVTAPVDGSRPPAVVPGSQEGADIGIGPRWIAGGSAITWGQSLHAGVISIPFGAGHVVWIPAAGGTQRSVVAGGAELKLQADGGAEQTLRTTYGIGQGCSAAPGLVRGSAGLATLVVGLAAWLRRRRKG